MSKFKAKIYSALYHFFLSRYHSAIKKVIKQDKVDKLANNMVITEHALLRYAERFKGFDVEAAKAELTAESLPQRVAKLNDGIYAVGDISVVVTNQTVVTAYEHSGKIGWNSLRFKESTRL